jgi:dihydroorotate dehydrogenase
MNSKLKNTIVTIRNAVFGFLYKYFLKPFLFLMDPEDVHDWFLGCGKFLGRHSLLRWKIRVWLDFSDKSLGQNIAGIKFKNPVGLAAGFDKNAEILPILPSVGFGFAEVGSVTGLPCAGNPRPRLWRLKKSRGLVVYYGLKNNGCEEISARLRKEIIGNVGKFEMPFGVSVAMTNRPENMDIETAISDYEKAFKVFLNVGDYITVNISCPNTSGGMPFLEPINLEKLLERLDNIWSNERSQEVANGRAQHEDNVGTGTTNKPIFVKMSPDKSFAEVDAILEILKKHRVHGIICSNLTKKPQNPLIFDKNLPNVGGISGKPVQSLADDLLSYIYKKEGRRFILIGCGGVFSAEDAYKKIRKGATLVELITGMIFEGPQLISEINLGLVKLLHRDGFSNISEAIGADFRHE